MKKTIKNTIGSQTAQHAAGPVAFGRESLEEAFA